MSGSSLALSLPQLALVVACASCAVVGGVVGSTQDSLRPVERKAVGVAAPYAADSSLRAQTDQLRASKSARRAAAWSALARVLSPSALADTSLPAPATLPVFRTWYEKDDLDRLFAHLYGDLSADQRKARAPFASDQIAAAFPWSASSLGATSEADYLARIAQVTSAESKDGLGGNSRVVYSQGSIQHLLENYSEVHDCLPTLPSFSFATTPPSDTNFASCYASEFPIDAAVVKQSWWRADFGMTVPVYDTSAATLSANLEGTANSGGWGNGTAQASPDSTSIYSVQMADGSSFRLPAIHLVTKELRDWLWITFWWAPNPNDDFGADRPDSIVALGGPWKNYKMCVVTSYDEGDPDPRGGFAGSLGDALAAVDSGVGGPTWCSNPYLEKGANNAQTNCIGCHQHAGMLSLSTSAILADPSTFPQSGRTKLRTAFPSDYMWSFNADPDKLAQDLEARIASYDAIDGVAPVAPAVDAGATAPTSADSEDAAPPPGDDDSGDDDEDASAPSQ